MRAFSLEGISTSQVQKFVEKTLRIIVFIRPYVIFVRWREIDWGL